MEGEKGGAALFSDQGSFEEYIDMLLHNAKMLAVTDRLEIFPSWVRGGASHQKPTALIDFWNE